MNATMPWRNAPKGARQAIITSLETGDFSASSDPVDLVRAPAGWGVYTSLGPNFQYAVFGRDSIETAEDILETHPELVRDIIRTLARLQGTKTDAITEEEPGKIHHEYRALHPDHDELPEESARIIQELQHKWGGEGTDEMIYYGSFDSTPLFVRLLDRYCKRWGASLLHETVHRRSDDSQVTIRESATQALAWLTSKLTDETLGLLAYKRMNPQGIINQAWKDSDTSYLHLDGSMPHPDAAVASIELQGYAYDALKAGVRLGLGTSEDQHRWQHTAHHLQQQTVRLLWMEDVQYFAQGLDFTDPSNPRQIGTITSNVGAALDSRLLHDLSPHDTTRYVYAIVRMLFSDELLTDVGIRCRAVRHRGLLSLIDYHGLNTVWPKETYDIAKGLRRGHFDKLADDLDRRLMRGLEGTGEFSEFIYVSRDGTVWYDTNDAFEHFGAESSTEHLVVPEGGQAWTIAAAVSIAHRHAGHHHTHTTRDAVPQ